MSKLHAIILAAGKGTRMKSKMPKVLHRIAGKSMLQHVLDRVDDLNAVKTTIIYGHEGEQVKTAINRSDINWVEQSEQLGTGHAVMQCIDHISDDDRVLILYGDVPFIDLATLTKLSENNTFNLLTLKLNNPMGYGRIIRNPQGAVSSIVEQKDANEEQLSITEINTGFLAIEGRHLKRYLANINNENAQQEYYLTDLVSIANADNASVNAIEASNELTVTGVNSRVQLTTLEKEYYLKIADGLLQDGVTITDPQRFDVRGNLKVGKDTIIDPNFLCEGDVSLGDNVFIESNVIIRNSKIGNNCHIKANSIIEDSVLEQQVSVGPFARLRPGTLLANKVQIGNFVETKKIVMGEGSKAGHLAYIGDAKIGKNVNIGAGTITCNYDGANKHQTIIEDNVFVGSDTQLVAPVTIGKNVTIAAGTTVTKNVEQDALVISRTKQKSIEGWKRPVKEKK
jgi:bifunctional UDP-N-acetylglucosamine pyrophosphorylase / glucosamine-1-phosphate N-acetyltransferase